MFNITSAPEPGMGGKTYSVLAGSVPGGGSTVNGMELDRASAADYDSWEQLGNPGWGWSGLFPYFKKANIISPAHWTSADRIFRVPTSRRQPLPSKPSTTTHGTPLRMGTGHCRPVTQSSSILTTVSENNTHVNKSTLTHPDPFFTAFEECSVPFIREHALGNAVGVFWTPASEDPKKKTRSSSLNAYYDPVSYRSNLKMLTEYRVTQVLFDRSLTAQGVEAIDRTTGKVYQFKANKEVILAAGGVHTPQVLQLSGIGPKDVLKAAGVPVKLNFPAVGSNFQDHPTAYLNWNCKSCQQSTSMM